MLNQLLSRFTIRAQIVFLVIALNVVIVAQGAIGVLSIQSYFDRMSRSYTENTVPIRIIAQVLEKMSDNAKQVFSALQHNPDRPEASIHDHPIELHIDKIDKNITDITGWIEDYKKHEQDPEERRLFDDFMKKRHEFASLVAKSKSALNMEEWSEVITYVRPMNKAYDEAQKSATALFAHLESQSSHRMSEVEEYFALQSKLTFAMVLVIVAGGMAFGLMIAFSIRKRIALLADAIRDVESNRDLSRPISLGGKDEVSQIAQTFDSLRESFRGILGSIKMTSSDVERSSREIRGAMDTLQSVNSGLSDSTSRISSSADRLSENVREVTMSADSVSGQVSHTTRVLIAKGVSAVESTVGEMRLASRAIEQSNAAVNVLADESEKIGEIAVTIGSIAEQTNLLALNAAIEAARAGDAGRGFAVVADEVRKLAERTTRSTRDVTERTDRVRAQVGNICAAMEEGVNRVTESSRLGESAMSILAEVRSGSESMAQSVESITVAMREQESAVGNISSQLESIARSSHSASASVRGSLENARNMEQAATRLSSETERFRT